jgi:hypothetical protein
MDLFILFLPRVKQAIFIAENPNYGFHEYCIIHAMIGSPSPAPSAVDGSLIPMYNDNYLNHLRRKPFFIKRAVQTMKTVVFNVKHLFVLNTWVDPVAPFLRESGSDIVILHATQLNYDTSNAAVLKDIPYRSIEISHKSMKEIIQLLADLRPVAIAVFTFRSLMDLLWVRLARHYGIKTIYIQHGFYVSTRFQMANKRARISRYLRFIKWYVSFLWQNRGAGVLDELRVVYQAMFRLNQLFNKSRIPGYLFQQSIPRGQNAVDPADRTHARFLSLSVPSPTMSPSCSWFSVQPITAPAVRGRTRILKKACTHQ